MEEGWPYPSDTSPLAVGEAAGLAPPVAPRDSVDVPPLADPAFLLAGSTAVMLLGLSKGGFAGVGALAVPLLALATGPVEAAAILLPILVVQDAVGVWAFRRDWDRGVVALMLPAAALGIALASLVAAHVGARGMEVALGTVTILFAMRSLWLARGGRIPAPAHPRRWLGALMGFASGFTSQLAHAGQPPFQIYVLPLRLPRDRLVGTTAIFFAAVNALKLPAYLALGQFTASPPRQRRAPARRDRRNAGRRPTRPPGRRDPLLHADLRPDAARRREAAGGWPGVTSISGCGGLPSDRCWNDSAWSGRP